MKIITLTLSPAVDIEYHTEKITPDGLNRTSSHAVTAGGKGVNVSRAILNCAREAGVDVQLETVVPLGGASGEMFRDILEREGLPVIPVEIEGNTRINASLIPDTGDSLEINAPGTPLGDRLGEVERLLLDRLKPGDVVVIAGSVPSDVPKSYPAELCRKIKAAGAVCLTDADGAVLEYLVKEGHPDLIKPNADELARLAGHELNTLDDVMDAAESLSGVGAVITTLAADGAVFTKPLGSSPDDPDEAQSSFYPTEERPVVRLKGAGDTFLGAYLFCRYIGGMDDHDAMVEATHIAGDYVAGV